jgi:phosphate transport system permease protein
MEVSLTALPSAVSTEPAQETNFQQPHRQRQRRDDIGQRVLGALLLLPLVGITTREALRRVPATFYAASYGLGATRWQTIGRVVLPAALPDIVGGVLVSLAFVLGEAALLILVSQLFIMVDPVGPFAQFTVLPIQVFAFSARTADQFRHLAAASALLLLGILLLLAAIGSILRQHARQRQHAYLPDVTEEFVRRR